jgi:hypothetical protein
MGKEKQRYKQAKRHRHERSVIKAAFSSNRGMFAGRRIVVLKRKEKIV